jgi:hypothetical protein
MEHEPAIIIPVAGLISDLSDKMDTHHDEVMAELKAQDTRITALEVQYKSMRVWGLVALFAGGAGGSLLTSL